MQEQVGVEMTESEARSELLDMAHGKTGAVSPEVLVDQVMAVTADGDWPVQREAMRAVLRRCAFAKRDGLRVTARPPGGRPLGIYRTAREGKSTRPYRTLIAGVQPIGASCDCPDFLRNSLGLCKHALVVLERPLRASARCCAGRRSCRERAPSSRSRRFSGIRSGRSAARGIGWNVSPFTRERGTAGTRTGFRRPRAASLRANPAPRACCAAHTRAIRRCGCVRSRSC